MSFTSGVIGKNIPMLISGTSGLFNIQQCYEGRLDNSWPIPLPTYTGYNPRFHNASTNPGAAFTKDMTSSTVNITYPSSFHPDGSSTQITGHAFTDAGNDLFDTPGFGGWTIFINNTNITIPFSSVNQSDGESNMTTEEFTGGGHTFEIKHGYPDVGVFMFRLRNKFDSITPFNLLFGGFVGSDGGTNSRHTTVDATLNSPSETLRIQIFQNADANDFARTEQFQIAVIPIKASEYGTGTSTNQILTSTPTGPQGSSSLDPQQLKTSNITEGLTFYLTKGNNLTNTANYIAADLQRSS
tara:strand:+ start:44 stop:937 length:894 start_codon:yes stop_codon:yes gene_type:complete